MESLILNPSSCSKTKLNSLFSFLFKADIPWKIRSNWSSNVYQSFKYLIKALVVSIDDRIKFPIQAKKLFAILEVE